MKTLQTILFGALYTSSILGIEILLMDKWLWSVAPTHAYGLIIFVIADGALLAAMWKERALAIIGAALLSAVQLAAMLGDIAIGQPAGISASGFMNYLLNDTIFLSLLATQAVVLGLATALITAPLTHRHRLALSQIT